MGAKHHVVCELSLGFGTIAKTLPSALADTRREGEGGGEYAVTMSFDTACLIRRKLWI